MINLVLQIPSPYDHICKNFKIINTIGRVSCKEWPWHLRMLLSLVSKDLSGFNLYYKIRLSDSGCWFHSSNLNLKVVIEYRNAHKLIIKAKMIVYLLFSHFHCLFQKNTLHLEKVCTAIHGCPSSIKATFYMLHLSSIPARCTYCRSLQLLNDLFSYCTSLRTLPPKTCFSFLTEEAFTESYMMFSEQLSKGP